MKNKGSFYFLAEWIADIDLNPDPAFATDHCGTCNACIDACPTNAILHNKVIDGSKCISYFTIELKGEIPSEYQSKLADRVFGCDICQDICPWNRFATAHHDERLAPRNKTLNMNRTEWKEMTEELFSEIFKKSAVKRTKYSGLMRNIKALEQAQSLL